MVHFKIHKNVFFFHSVIKTKHIKNKKKGKNFARSLYVVEDINPGDIISEKNVKSIRPGFGLHPKHYQEIVGKLVTKSAEKGDRFSLNIIS